MVKGATISATPQGQGENALYLRHNKSKSIAKVEQMVKTGNCGLLGAQQGWSKLRLKNWVKNLGFKKFLKNSRSKVFYLLCNL